MANNPLTGTRSHWQQKHLQWDRHSSGFCRRPYKWCFQISDGLSESHKIPFPELGAFSICQVISSYDGSCAASNKPWGDALTWRRRGQAEGSAGARPRLPPPGAPLTHGSKRRRTQAPRSEGSWITSTGSSLVGAARGHVACAQERPAVTASRAAEVSPLSLTSALGYPCGWEAGRPLRARPGATQGTSESPLLLFPTRKGFLAFLTVPSDLRGKVRAVTRQGG